MAVAAEQLRKGFDYGKQRCTAYVRFIVQRELFPQFLEMYLPVLRSLRFGNPVLVESAADSLPRLDFGPLINSKKVEELCVLYVDALGKGAISLYEASVSESMIFPNQDISAYVGPAALLGIPRNCRLYHAEPFGPLDTILVRRSSRRACLGDECLEWRAGLLDRMRRPENRTPSGL